MRWEKILKTEILKDLLDEVVSELKSVVNHALYDEADLEREIHNTEAIRMLRTVIQHIDNPDDFPLERYTQHYGNTHLTGILQFILTETAVLKRKYAINRSMEFLSEVAETFGVEIRTVNYNYIEFRHRNMIFTLTPRGVRINPPATKGVQICVVDEKKLPLGDYYASLLGLIIAKPEELDVVNFGIKLAEILGNYPDYYYIDESYDYASPFINIFTPFVSHNEENQAFLTLIDKMKNDEEDPYVAKWLLEAIEKALIECFGSTRGFFE